jgi:hypothetical protein
MHPYARNTLGVETWLDAPHPPTTGSDTRLAWLLLPRRKEAAATLLGYTHDGNPTVGKEERQYGGSSGYTDGGARTLHRPVDTGYAGSCRAPSASRPAMLLPRRPAGIGPTVPGRHTGPRPSRPRRRGPPLSPPAPASVPSAPCLLQGPLLLRAANVWSASVRCRCVAARIRYACGNHHSWSLNSSAVW